MSQTNAKIIYLTAGAAGMYCGSCMHDNTLAKSLAEQGWDIQLVPMYTPIRTDETDISVDHVLFGGLNVFLQQKIPFFRYLPAAFDRILDNPRLIRRVTARAMDTDAKTLGSLTLSMLKGVNGNQRKEVHRMCRWLQNEKPDLIIFSNILIGGCIAEIKKTLGIPVLVTLQGDDVFLDSLQPPYRDKCIAEIKMIAQQVDGFIVHTEFFRSYMSDYFGIDPQKINVTPLGIDIRDFQQFRDRFRDNSPAKQTRMIGYLARLAPEKGLQHLVDAFMELKKRNGFDDVKLKIAGWLSPQNSEFAQSQWKRLDAAGLNGDYEYLGSIDRAAKLKLLSQIDILSVPTDFKEPKGLYALEAMAAGIPIVKPAHGAFPELIQQSGGGTLFEPGNMLQLVNALVYLLLDVEQRVRLGKSGQQFVHEKRNAASMAQSTAAVFRQYLVKK